MAMDYLDFSLISPFTCSIIGGTQSGKTDFTLSLIERRKEVINKPIDKVLYIYSDYQPIFYDSEKSDPNIVFTDNIYDLNNLVQNPCLVIIDDHQDIISENKDVAKLVSSFFIKKAHHLSASTIVICQNGFADRFVNIARNSNYVIIFDLLGDKSILTMKNRQCCPHNPGFLPDAYQKAMELRNYAYLFLDFHPARTYKKYWARSHLDPVPDCQVYVPRNKTS